MVDLVETESTTPSPAGPLAGKTRRPRSHGSCVRARRGGSPSSLPPKNTACPKRGRVPHPWCLINGRRIRYRHQDRLRITGVEPMPYVSTLKSRRTETRSSTMTIRPCIVSLGQQVRRLPRRTFYLPVRTRHHRSLALFWVSQMYHPSTAISLPSRAALP